MKTLTRMLITMAMLASFIAIAGPASANSSVHLTVAKATVVQGDTAELRWTVPPGAENLGLSVQDFENGAWVGFYDVVSITAGGIPAMVPRLGKYVFRLTVKDMTTGNESFSNTVTVRVVPPNTKRYTRPHATHLSCTAKQVSPTVWKYTAHWRWRGGKGYLGNQGAQKKTVKVTYDKAVGPDQGSSAFVYAGVLRQFGHRGFDVFLLGYVGYGGDTRNNCGFSRA